MEGKTLEALIRCRKIVEMFLEGGDLDDAKKY